MAPVQGALTFDWLEQTAPPRPYPWDSEKWWQDVHVPILELLKQPGSSATPAEMTVLLWHHYGRRLAHNGVSKRLAELAVLADPPALERTKEGHAYRYRRVGREANR